MNALTTDRLQQIAETVKAEHAKIEGLFREGLSRAFEVGKLLNEAKELVKHGEWGSWIADNCQFSERTAQQYMRVASGLPELTKSATVADLTYREAVALLAEPKEETKTLTAAEQLEQELCEQFPDFKAWRAAGHPTKEELEESDRENERLFEDIFAFADCKSPRAVHKLAETRIAEYLKKGAIKTERKGGMRVLSIVDGISIADHMIIQHAINAFLFPKFAEAVP